MPSYSYDEESDVWPYFAVTLGSLVLVPWTIGVLSPVLFPAKKQTNQVDVAFRPANATHIDSYKSKQLRGRLLSKRNMFLVAGWAALAAALVFIASKEIKVQENTFDPYEIMGVSFSATEKQIKSHYKKLSVKFHPDKIRLTANQTLEEVENVWVEITKAYKSLTDEVTRNNFLEFGHPDGPQPTSHGIALPKWLVEGQGSPFLVGTYALVVGVLLPWFIGTWWSGVKSYTRRGIHNKTAASFFSIMAKEQPDYITHKRILEAISDAEEYKILFPDRTSKQIYELLNDYLNRKHYDDAAKEAVKLGVAARAPKLLDGFADIAIEFKPLEVVQRIIEVQRAVVQAVPLDHLPLGEMLQLPHVSLEKLAKNHSKGYGTASILGFSEAEHKKILGVEKADIAAIKTTANAVPKIDIVDAYFKVPGEDIVTPQSAAHMVLRIRVRPFSAKKPLNLNIAKLKKDLHEDEPISVLKEPTITNSEAPLLPATYAPYFPALHQGKWLVFMTSDKDNKIVEGPGEITRLDVSNLTVESLDDDALIGTFKIQLKNPTPMFPGKFSYKVNVLSTAYFGVDTVEKLNVEIENPVIPADDSDDDEDDDISEPEEDSIAGALATARGQKTSKKKVVEEDDEEDSEEEEDLSDIDTDTEDEAEDPKKK